MLSKFTDLLEDLDQLVSAYHEVVSGYTSYARCEIGRWTDEFGATVVSNPRYSAATTDWVVRVHFVDTSRRSGAYYITLKEVFDWAHGHNTVAQ